MPTPESAPDTAAWWLVGYAYPDTPIIGPFDSREDAQKHQRDLIFPPWWRATANVRTPAESRQL